MARIFEYIIITNTRHDYRAEGTSHENAMENFVADPQLVYGFHSGNYEVESGESFIVIGPTQEKPDSNEIVRLVANERKCFVFRTPEQIQEQQEVERHVQSFLKDAKKDAKVTVSARDGSIPPHNKTALAEDIRIDFRRGVWVNGKRIPWSAITGIDYADT